MELAEVNRVWELTDLEFVALWEVSAIGLLPTPLVFSYDTRRSPALLREKANARRRLQDTSYEELKCALHAFNRPDLRVVVYGCDGGDPTDPSGHIRILAVRCDRIGYVVAQIASEAPWHRCSFTVGEVHPVDLAETVVDSLPKVPAGALGDVDLTTARSLPVLHHPATTTGMIEISAHGSRHGSRSGAIHELYWRDLRGDGRYLILEQDPPVALSVDAARFATVISSVITTASAAIDDDLG